MTQLSQPRTSTPQLHPHIAGKVRQLAPDPATRILDLGCGSGALLERLAGMGYRDLTGVDISPPASGGSITYRQADLDCFRLDVPDGAFDLALAVEVIEHIENPGLFLAELARLLCPGGIGLFTTPNLHSAQAKLLFGLTDRLKQFDSKGDPTHITPIVLFPYTRLLNRHGFSVLESWGSPGRRQFAHVEAVDAPGGTAVAADRANIHCPWRHAVSVDPAQRCTAGIRSQWCVEGFTAHLSLLKRSSEWAQL